MAVLTPDELTALRRQVSAGVVPVTWDKPTLNTALQGAEDLLETQAFDTTPFVTLTSTTSPRAQNVKTALETGQIPANLVPVVEDWLKDHPPSVTVRSMDRNAIRAWVTANRPAFASAVDGMPEAQRVKVVRLVVRRRVEAVV